MRIRILSLREEARVDVEGTSGSFRQIHMIQLLNFMLTKIPLFANLFILVVVVNCNYIILIVPFLH